MRTIISLDILKDSKGQSMVEFAVAAPVLIVFLYSVIYLSNLYISKHNTLISARYAARHLSRNNQTNLVELRRNISTHFFNDEKIKIRYDNSPGNFVDGMPDYITSVIGRDVKPGYYHISVEYSAPMKFGALDLSKEGRRQFNIKSEHYVGGNSWNGYDIDSHDVVDIIMNTVKNLIDFFF